MTKLNQTVDFLGCQLGKSSSGDYFLSQSSYIKKFLQHYTPIIRPATTPLPPREQWIIKPRHSREAQFSFREALGKLGYLRYSRPDLLHSIHYLAKLPHQQTERVARSAILHTFGCLLNTIDYKLTFYAKPPLPLSQSTLVGFSDAAFAVDTHTRKSCGGHCIYYNQNLIGAQSGAQSRVTTSSGEAELTAIYACGKDMVFFQGLLNNLQEPKPLTAILTESSSSIQTIQGEVSSRFKFFRYIFISWKSWPPRQASRSLTFLEIKTQQNCLQNNRQQKSSKN